MGQSWSCGPTETSFFLGARLGDAALGGCEGAAASARRAKSFPNYSVPAIIAPQRCIAFSVRFYAGFVHAVAGHGGLLAIFMNCLVVAC